MTAVPGPYLKAQRHLAQRHLARRDPVLKRLIAAVGPCTLRYEPNGFAALVRSIISQQISTKAAAAIHARLLQAAGADSVTPASILTLPDQTLRSVGLSAAKARALRDLAEKVKSGEVVLDNMHEETDEGVITHLLPVHGIGRWTAEMFLIFSLGRLDVLPVHDWGLRVGVQRQYNLPAPPGKDQLVALAEPWQPYRSVATWYFWRSLGFVPQSGEIE